MAHCDCPTPKHKNVEACFNFKRLNRVMLAIALKAKSVLSWMWKLALSSSSDEPIVRERHDRLGQTYFQVYDPATRCSASLYSEQEVRQWLEQHFYCR